MIVNVRDSGVLEFFWRHPVSTSVFRFRPSDFLSLRTRQGDNVQMREWLSVQPGCESVRSLNDPKIVKRIAVAVRSGEIALAMHQSYPRLPGTGVAIDSLFGPVLLLPYRAVSRNFDLAYALTWLSTLSDAETIKWLQTVLAAAGNSSGVSLRESNDVLADIGRLLRSGELIPVFRSYPSCEHNEVHEAQPLPMPDNKMSREHEEIDPGTFASNHAVMTQASALISAADTGIPFCEVCNRQ